MLSCRGSDKKLRDPPEIHIIFCVGPMRREKKEAKKDGRKDLITHECGYEMGIGRAISPAE